MQMQKKGFVLEPKDGSIVIITPISDTLAFVAMVSEVEQIYLNGDNEGGLIKITDITTELNNRYTILKTYFWLLLRQQIPEYRAQAEHPEWLQLTMQ